LCFSVFIAADDQTVIVTLLPSMTVDLGIAVGELNKVSWTITSYLLGFTIVMPIAGKICDKYGYRTTLISSLLFFSMGSFLVAITVNIPEMSIFPSKLNWLIIFRFLQAMGGGAIVPISIATVSIILEKKYWIYGFGLIGASAEAGGVIGPLWGSLILKIWNWPGAFYINIPLSLLMIVMIMYMPKSNKHSMKIKLIDTILFSLILIVSTIIISEFKVLDLGQIVLISILLILVITVFYRLTKLKQDLIPEELFRYPTFVWAFITHLLIGSSLIIIMVTIPLSASTLYQLDTMVIGLSLLKLTAFIGIGSIIGILTNRFSAAFTLILASCLTSAGIFLYSENISTPTNELNIIFYIIGLGYGLFIVPIHNIGLFSINEKIRGITSSMISLSRMLGMIFGLSLMTTIGTARFADLVTGIQVFSLDPTIQTKINQEINFAGLEVFKEILIGSFVFSILTLLTAVYLSFVYVRIKKSS
jgi:hypothetical protein